MSPSQRWSRHDPHDAPRDAHSPGYWTRSPSGYESPRGASGPSNLAYTYGTRTTTTWTIPRDKTVHYVFPSRTPTQRNWSAYSNESSMEPEIQHPGSLRVEAPRASRYHDHEHIEDDSYPTNRGPSYRDSLSPEYSRPRSSDRTYWQGDYNSKSNRSQDHRSHSYSSGEESYHKSSKHRRDKGSSQTKFESQYRSSRSHYSDDRSRRNDFEPESKISSRRRDEDFGRSNRDESGRTSNQNHYENDSGRSRTYEPDYRTGSRYQNEDNSRSNTYEPDYRTGSRYQNEDNSRSNTYEPDYRTGSRYQNEDNSRSNKYKREPRYEKARQKIPSIIEDEEEELPSFYATLGISSFASSLEIKKAAKMKRVEVHPDRCIKPDMSGSEKSKAYEIAAAVGQAADVLTDRELKSEYDRKLARQWAL